MIDENGERISKVDYQIKKWAERGVLGYVRSWVLGAWGQNYQKGTIIRCLEEQGLLENSLSNSERFMLADCLIGGLPRVNKDNALDTVSGIMIKGLLDGNNKMTDVWLDISREKLKERYGFNVEDKKNEGVQITINTGAAIPDLGIQDLTSTVNVDSGDELSNIETVDPLDDLKDDPAYNQLLKDREVENDE